MKNLTGTGDAETAIAELQSAKIAVFVTKPWGECKIPIQGELCGWKFRRAWNYWIATSPKNLKISTHKLIDFDLVWGAEVRAHGYAGGGALTTRDYVETFHIDSQAGLVALCGFILSVHRKRL